MQTGNVSEPIFSNAIGWFRYNYDQSCLEFLNHETKLIVQTWVIPTDQWEALPSKREYCENIVKEANQQAQNQAAANQKEKSSAFMTFIISAIPAAICWFWYLTDDTIVNTTQGLVISTVAVIASVIAVSAFTKYKKY